MRIRSFFAVIGALALLSGCQKPPTDMSMKPPPRAPELDNLEPLVGNWESSSEADMHDGKEPTKSKGKSSVWWEADKTVLVGRWEEEMGPDASMRGLEIWRWDPSRKRYSTFWVDNYGGMGHGTAKYDAATKKFISKGRSSGPMGDTINEGWMRLVDNNNIEWSFTAWDSWKMKKLMEVTSKSVRK